MVEGPGHIPLHQIQMNVEKEQKICDGAPFYVLGPVVTDIGLGYDHIVSAIGAAVAAQYGAALLCCVTPSEHLGLPTVEEIRAGVIAFKIAAHAGDIARGVKGARERDDAISDARMKFDWKSQFELAIDGVTACKMFTKRCKMLLKKGRIDYCTMCGRNFCAIRTFNRLKKSKIQ
jgi:phosphomethylpyrimidine synthase